MRKIARTIACCAGIGAGMLLFCSLDEQTAIGGGIINDVDPDKVNVGRHYREFLLDSTVLDTSYSLPGVGDAGFGVHEVTKSVMVVGRKDREEAAGFVRFLCSSDTNRSKGGRLFYQDDDSLVAVKLIFGRVSKGSDLPPFKMKVFSASTLNRVFEESGQNSADTLTMADTSLLDSVTLPPGALRDSIFRSCMAMEDTSYDGDTFGFGLLNVSRDTLYRLYSESSILKVSVRRRGDAGKTDTLSKPYKAVRAYYVAREDSSEVRTLQHQTVSSYASSRTAVYQYTASSLWHAMTDSVSGSVNNLISAVFVVRHPRGETGQLFVKAVLDSAAIPNAAVLDSLFALQAPVNLKDSTWSLYGNVRRNLQQYARAAALPPSLFLYLRLSDRSASLAAVDKETWHAVTWDAVPYLKTIIYIP
ncbi:MAG: hypothetical protein JXA71_09270 [Chitinispirillaceae bacterium]|nr:hypothetical protein [Chitinispirillaceae bacterium]